MDPVILHLAVTGLHNREHNFGGCGKVSDIFRAVRSTESVIRRNSEPLTDGLIQDGGFMCCTDSLETSDSPMMVQVGDIIGACVFDPQNGDRFQ